jgi:hypothetical protein
MDGDKERQSDSYKDAYEASRVLRGMAAEEGMMIKVEPSPYGGYRVRSYPIDEESDVTIDLLMLSNRKQGYLK